MDTASRCIVFTRRVNGLNGYVGEQWVYNKIIVVE